MGAPARTTVNERLREMASQERQLAEEVADFSELTQMRDEWRHTMLREQKYNPGEIDAQWSPAMVDEFQ
jgi:hypothetical protein